VLLIVLAFSPDGDENSLLMLIFTAIVLFLWDGPKTQWGYVIAVVISVVAAGFTYWLIRL
jgi:hypothetical protein